METMDWWFGEHHYIESDELQIRLLQAETLY